MMIASDNEKLNFYNTIQDYTICGTVDRTSLLNSLFQDGMLLNNDSSLKASELTQTLQDLEQKHLGEIIRQTHRVVDQQTLLQKWKIILDNSSGKWGATQHTLNFSDQGIFQTPPRAIRTTNPLLGSLTPAVAVSIQDSGDRHKNWANNITLLLAAECDQMIEVQQKEDREYVANPYGFGFNTMPQQQQNQPQTTILTPTKNKNSLQNMIKAGLSAPTFPSSFKMGEPIGKHIQKLLAFIQRALEASMTIDKNINLGEHTNDIDLILSLWIKDSPPLIKAMDETRSSYDIQTNSLRFLISTILAKAFMLNPTAEQSYVENMHMNRKDKLENYLTLQEGFEGWKIVVSLHKTASENKILSGLTQSYHEGWARRLLAQLVPDHNQTLVLYGTRDLSLDINEYRQAEILKMTALQDGVNIDRKGSKRSRSKQDSDTSSEEEEEIKTKGKKKNTRRVSQQGICPYFLSPKGCFKGKTCQFQHEQNDNNICNAWATTGQCKFGNNCKYEHAPTNVNNPNQGICHNWLTKGACSFGGKCRYSHAQQVNNTYGHTHECRYWNQKGGCRDAQNCRFLHNGLTPNNINNLNHQRNQHTPQQQQQTQPHQHFQYQPPQSHYPQPQHPPQQQPQHQHPLPQQQNQPLAQQQPQQLPQQPQNQHQHQYQRQLPQQPSNNPNSIPIGGWPPNNPYIMPGAGRGIGR